MQKREVWLVLYRVGGVIKRTAPFETEEDAKGALEEFKAEGITDAVVKRVGK